MFVLILLYTDKHTVCFLWFQDFSGYKLEEKYRGGDSGGRVLTWSFLTAVLAVLSLAP